VSLLHIFCEVTIRGRSIYAGTRYYLDAAAWAALGDVSRAMRLLRERLDAETLAACSLASSTHL